jgi:hypothetical protein
MLAVSNAPPAHPAADLLGTGRPSLAGWYAGPADTGLLDTLRASAEADLQVRLRRGESRFRPQLLLAVCDCLAGADIGPAYRELRSGVRDQRAAALLELVVGQLLVSRKQQPATFHLVRGFRKAARYLDTRAYFRLVHRHELLDCLVLSAAPGTVQPLASLLAEAGVIRRLRQHAGRRHAFAHRDTLG